MFNEHLEEKKHREHLSIPISTPTAHKDEAKNVVAMGQIDHMEHRHATLLSENINEPNFQSFKRMTDDRGHSRTASPHSVDENSPTREQFSNLRTAIIQKDNEVLLLDHISPRHSQFFKSTN